MGSKGRQHRQAISITEVRAVWMWRTSCIQDQSSSGSPVLLWTSVQTGLASSASRAERTGLCAGGWAVEPENGSQKPAGFFPGRVPPEAQRFFPPLIQLRALPAGVGVKYTVHISLWNWVRGKNNSNHDPCISGVFITHPECHRPQELGDRPRALKHVIKKMSTTQSIISNVCLMCGAAESSKQETVE